MQSTRGKCQSQELISNPINSLWHADFFSFLVNGRTKFFQNITNNRPRSDFCPRRDLQRHNNNNLVKKTSPVICVHFFKPRGTTTSLMQLWSSSPRCIFYWSSWKFSFPKQMKYEKFNSWYRDNKKVETGQDLGETHPTAHATGVSEKIRNESRWLVEQKLCLYSFLTDPKESGKRNAGAFRTRLQCFISVWFQQCKMWSQCNQIPFSTQSRYQTRYWTYCHQESKPVHLLQNWWYSTIGYSDVSWRHTKLQKQKESSCTECLITLTNAEYRSSPIRRFLQ